MTEQIKPIVESNNFIVLAKYIKDWEVSKHYQSEADLERELVADLVNQGYEYLSNLDTPKAMLANVQVQLQNLNKILD